MRDSDLSSYPAKVTDRIDLGLCTCNLFGFWSIHLLTVTGVLEIIIQQLKYISNCTRFLCGMNASGCKRKTCWLGAATIWTNKQWKAGKGRLNSQPNTTVKRCERNTQTNLHYSPGRPPRLSHSSWTMSVCLSLLPKDSVRIFFPF